MILKEYLDIFVFVYLDDILIYSKTKEQHIKHVNLVLCKLRQHCLYERLKKCVFHRHEINYLKFLINDAEIRMQFKRIETITFWLEFFFFFEVRQFLEFVKFYRRFIYKFNIITEFLSNLLKKNENEKIYRSFLITNEIRKIFNT